MNAAASLVAPDCEVPSGPATAVGLEEGRDTSGRGRRLWSRFDGCVRVQAFFSGLVLAARPHLCIVFDSY